MSATSEPHRIRWSRHAVVAGVILLAVVAGYGVGDTLALWRDEYRATARMPVGVAVFGVGAPGEIEYATVDGESLTFEFGPEQAEDLYGTLPDGGAVAIPVQVDSLAQGHRGLSYTVTPSVSGGVFGASTWALYRVPNVAACTTSTTGTPANSSTPWSTAYTSTGTPTSEFWCLVAKFEPVTGDHENTVTVVGTPDTPGVTPPREPTDTATWHATVEESFDLEHEPVHTLAFTFSTTRSGGTP